MRKRHPQHCPTLHAPPTSRACPCGWRTCPGRAANSVRSGRHRHGGRIAAWRGPAQRCSWQTSRWATRGAAAVLLPRSGLTILPARAEISTEARREHTLIEVERKTLTQKYSGWPRHICRGKSPRVVSHPESPGFQAFRPDRTSTGPPSVLMPATSGTSTRSSLNHRGKSPEFSGRHSKHCLQCPSPTYSQSCTTLHSRLRSHADSPGLQCADRHRSAVPETPSHPVRPHPSAVLASQTSTPSVAAFRSVDARATSGTTVNCRQFPERFSRERATQPHPQSNWEPGSPHWSSNCGSVVPYSKSGFACTAAPSWCVHICTPPD